MTSSLPESVVSQDVPATLYLNERLVLDMLASLQDGFAQTVRVDRVRADSGTSAAEASGGASIPFLSLIGLHVSGRGTKATSRASQAAESMDRTHTVSSLFSLLRSQLRQHNLVRSIDSLEDLKSVRAGDFVEAEVRLSRNGLTEVVRAIKTFIELGESMAQIEKAVPQGARRGAPMPKVDATLKKQIDWILGRAKPGKFEDLVGTLIADSSVKLVMPTDLALFFDPTMSESLSSDVRVFGKATRVLMGGDRATISLLRGTDLGSMAPGLWTGIVAGMATDDLRKSLAVPDTVEVTVAAPALQVIPVAVFA